MPKILVVDDSPVNTKIISGFLKDEYEIIIANHGEKAIELATAEIPDLILLDIVMPEVDGIFVCKFLKDQVSTAEIPVIFITSSSESQDIIRAFEAGGQDYITKPFNSRELYVRVRAHLELKNSKEEVKEYATQLETKNQELHDRTAEVEKAYEELEQAMEILRQTQSKLVQSEKMAALGQLVAGVAHEINTPIGAAKAAAEGISNALTDSLLHLQELFAKITPETASRLYALVNRGLTNTIVLSTREEREIKRKLRSALETEMIPEAALIADKLVMMGINDNADEFLPLFREKDIAVIMQTAYELVMLRKNVGNILLAIDKTSKIVFALKSYTHFSDDDKPLPVNIREGLETVLTIYQNQFKQGIELIKNFDPVSVITGYADQLSQVWTNIIHNAIQAMSGKGKLTIEITQEQDQVVVRFTDNGPGIAPEVMPRIFEPFFTTKKSGEGSGLGLDICRRIIDKHQGRIEVQSEPGKTVFAVGLPIKNSTEQG